MIPFYFLDDAELELDDAVSCDALEDEPVSRASASLIA